MSKYDIIFEGNNLNTYVEGAKIENTNLMMLPKRDIKTNKIARASLSKTTSSEYVDKNLLLYFEFCRSDRSALDQQLNLMKAITDAEDGQFIGTVGFDTVEWKATRNEFNINYLSGGIALLETVFIASTPIGKGQVQVTAFDSFPITTQTATVGFTVAGSYYIEPQIFLYVSSVTGGTNQSVSITNSYDSKGITITRTWAANDLIEINVERKAVFINGSMSNYSGTFPQFRTGYNVMNYTDTFTTRNVSLTTKYYNRYL